MAKKEDFKDPKAAELDGVIQVKDQGSAGDVNLDINTPNNGSREITTIEEPKAAINTKKAAEVVSGGLNSVMSGGLRRGATAFSGGADAIQGDNSATTKEDKPYRSGDRVGKRSDPITRKADTVEAEVFMTKRHESKPLAETTDGQGYNGEYRNEHVITQRNSGGVPGDPMFERSVDEIDVDMLYYPAGQFNKAKNTGNLAISDWDSSLNNGQGGYKTDKVTVTLGNYLNRKLTVQITENNGALTITGFAFDKTNLSLDKIDEKTYRAAGDAFLRFNNQSEIDRQIMIHKAGNESDPSWSPLGDAVIDATDQNKLTRLLEANAGNHVYLSIRKLSHALSYQINKLKKDGPRVTGPMAEMVNGNVDLIGYGADGYVSEANGRSRCFSQDAYVKGSAALWLALNDSLPKYTTKAKLLSLPLSFKSAISTAISNCQPLVMDQLLVTEMEKNELFSTIDGPYDPLKPIIVTDKAGLITPIPIDLGCSLSDGVLDTTIYVQHYENLRNKYNIRIRNYFVEAIFRWIKERLDRIWNACKDKVDNHVLTINIPIVSSTTSLSLWDLIVCSSVPYMIEARKQTLTELLKYEGNHGYPYTGIVHLKDIDCTKAENFSFSSSDFGLGDSVAKPIPALKVMMPEVFWPIAKVNAEGNGTGHNGIAAFTVLPHYFVQNQFKYDKDNDTDVNRKLILSDEAYTMAYPGMRDGNNLSYMDNIYGMSEEDYRLALDRMVIYPGYEPSYSQSKVAQNKSDNKVYLASTYKYGLTSDGIPVIPYFAYAESSNNVGEILQVQDVLSTPRELGLFQVAPAGVLSPVLGKDGNNHDKLNTVSMTSSFLNFSGPGFRAKVYHALGNQQNVVLAAGSLNIDYNASVTYVWDSIYANPYSAATDIGIKFNAGVNANSQQSPFVSNSYGVSEGTYDESIGLFVTSESKNNDLKVYTCMKYFWNRIQRLPFIVNPFDCNSGIINDASNTITGINSHDIFDMLYIFGFIGFRASDYSELAYERNKLRIAKGMNYVDDPYVNKSLLLK